MRAALQLTADIGFAMTPQLQESIRLLQLSSLEFEQEIEQAVAENPFLERVSAECPAAGDCESTTSVDARNDPAAALGGDIVGAESDQPWRAYPAARADGDTDFGSSTPMPTTLRDHLVAQLASARLTPRERSLVELVIEALDGRGYLRESIDELLALCPPQLQMTSDEVQAAVRFVQSLEPAGIAATSLQECLELQIRAGGAERPAAPLAWTIVRHHLEVLAAHDFLRLRRELGCTDEELRLANALILSCDPKPGERFGRDETRYVVPDVLVRKVDGGWIATVNAAVVPDVRINRAYEVIVRRRREECSAQFAQQLQDARWTIRNLRQRFSTIQRVAQAIVERQRRFFDHGPIAMKPLMMRDVAVATGLHESTVSRAVNGKYMATPRGLFELRHFFGSHVVTVDGMACSSTAIRALIRQIIAAEPKGRPLSDIKVTRILLNRGIRVARRTVSKYRDAMRIPSVEVRRMAA